jgi:hypothetical protein
MFASRTGKIALVITVTLLATFAIRSASGLPKRERLTEAQALDLQKRFEAAQIAADQKTVASLMADNATFVHGSMRVQTKAEFVPGIGRGPVSIEGPDRKVVLFDNGALVEGPTTFTMLPRTPSGEPTAPPRIEHVYLATLWVHTDAGWQVLLSQTTEAFAPVPPAPPAGR